MTKWNRELKSIECVKCEFTCHTAKWFTKCEWQQKEFEIEYQKRKKFKILQKFNRGQNALLRIAARKQVETSIVPVQLEMTEENEE